MKWRVRKCAQRAPQKDNAKVTTGTQRRVRDSNKTTSKYVAMSTNAEVTK